MKYMFSALLLLLVAPLYAGAAEEQSAKADNAHLIQGEWTLVSVDNGVKEKEMWLKYQAIGAILVIHGDRVALKCSIKKGEEFTLEDGAEALRIKLFPSRSPKEIDMKIGEFPDSIGIYELNKDSLKLCMGNHKDVPRPTKLETKPNGDFALIVLKRTKKDGEKEK